MMKAVKFNVKDQFKLMYDQDGMIIFGIPKFDSVTFWADRSFIISMGGVNGQVREVISEIYSLTRNIHNN